MKKTTFVCAMLALASLAVPTSSQAQTNSWISSTRGYWDDFTKWSLGVTPTNTQTICITNAFSKTVTVDSITSGSHGDTMTVSNLTLGASAGETNTLELSDAGTNVPLRGLDTISISAGGVLVVDDSALLVQPANPLTGGMLIVDGTVILGSNSRLLADCGLYVGLNTNANGSLLMTGGQMDLTNQFPFVIGVNGSGQMIISNGQVQAGDRSLAVGLGNNSQGTLAIAGGNYVSSSGGQLLVGMGSGALGVVSVTSGNLIMTDALISVFGDEGSGQLTLFDGTNVLGPVDFGSSPGGQGTLAVAGGVNEVQGALLLGSSPGATGTIWMTGGQLVQTNAFAFPGTTNYWPTYVGSDGIGSLTISNGAWLGGAIIVAPDPDSVGAVSVNGGSMTLLAELTVGDCSEGGAGSVNVTAGALYVTNAAHDAVLDLRGQLNLSGGLLQVDQLIITNVCAQFVRAGGTLNVGTAVLDPNLDADGDGLPNGWEQAHGFDPLNPADAGEDNDGDGMSNLQEYQAGTDPTNGASVFQIVEVAVEDDDVLVTWTAVGGKRYALQTTTGNGSGIMNNFVDLNPAFVAPGTGETTMTVLDLGAATGTPARFYRVRLVP